MKDVTDSLLDRYFEVTGKAIGKVKPGRERRIDWQDKYNDFFDMAKRYYDDAGYFRKKGDFVRAYACLNYAHGWLDAGARLGLFDVGGDSELFTVDREMFED